MRHLLDSVARSAQSLDLTVERAGRIDHVDHPAALLALLAPSSSGAWPACGRPGARRRDERCDRHGFRLPSRRHRLFLGLRRPRPSPGVRASVRELACDDRVTLLRGRP
jgi:hypothetical protein